MDFPIVELLDALECETWLCRHFHPEGLQCPRCAASVDESYAFRRTKRSQVQVHRCKGCGQTYTLYSGTVFEGHQLRPAQVILLLRGIIQGVSAARLARELVLSRTTVHYLRSELQSLAVERRPTTALNDTVTETDELFQNAGEKKRAASRSRRSTAPARE